MKIVISNNIILNLNQEEIDVDEFIQISEKLKGFQKDYPYESEEEKNTLIKVKQVLKNEEKLKPKQILWERKQIKWTKQKAIALAKIKFNKNLSYDEKYLKFKEMFPNISQEYFTSNYLEKGFYKILQKYKINKHNLKLYNYSLKETETKTKIKRAKARHNWNEQGRDNVIEMIKIHYTGTKEDRDRLAKKHNDSYLNLSKSFSGLIKRFNIKPGEIGLKKFKKEFKNENKEEIKNFINKMSEKVYDMRIKDNKEFSEIRKELNITNTEARQYYKRHYDFINKQQILENNEFNGNNNYTPIKIKTAEEELIKFFNEIELHTPEQIQKAIMLLYDYLKNLKGREIMANDIIEFLNEKVNEEKAIEIINNNRNNIIQWIGE
jgi:hypothetical protein